MCRLLIVKHVMMNVSSEDTESTTKLERLGTNSLLLPLKIPQKKLKLSQIKILSISFEIASIQIDHPWLDETVRTVAIVTHSRISY